MSRITDPHYLLAGQYQDAANLNARIELHRRFSVNTYGWHRWVFDHLDLPVRCRVLELGCGPADLWRENLGRIPVGWDVTLSDLSPGMVEQARANLARAADEGLAFHFEVIDAQSIPCAGAAFDAVIANHMLYHIPDRPRALAQIRRVLKPGGTLYAATVGETHLHELNELVRSVQPAAPAPETSAPLFGLENGAQQLAPWFAEIVRYDYHDALVVTEAGPLVAYVRSSQPWYELATDDEAMERFGSLLQQRITADGAIHITKSSGLFVGRAT